MAHNIETQRQQLITSLRNGGVNDERVLSVIATTPREIFIDEAQRSMAYADCALPIAMGQTISQPLMVALMTQALQLSGKEKVLEIGTGSGYQTAILARLSAHVTSVERHQQLAFLAAKHLMQLGITNVSLYVGDGSLVPRTLSVNPSLVDQLVTWGMLVIPVGSHTRQDLLVVHRAPWGPEIRSLGGCVFVPLVGEKGWSE